MRRTLFALMLLGLTANVVGQAKPDFSGRWNLESPANITGEDQIVKQEESTLSVTHISGPKHAPVVFKLDGNDTRSVVTMRGDEIVTISKAVLTAEGLTITSTTTYPGGRKANEKHIWTLSEGGRKLTIDLTQSGDGRPETKQTLVFKKGKA